MSAPSKETMIGLLATGVGSWGMFGKRPRVLEKYKDNMLVNSFAMFVLLWQGQGKNDVSKALVGTIGMIGVRVGLDGLSDAGVI